MTKIVNTASKSGTGTMITVEGGVSSVWGITMLQWRTLVIKDGTTPKRCWFLESPKKIREQAGLCYQYRPQILLHGDPKFALRLQGVETCWFFGIPDHSHTACNGGYDPSRRRKVAES